MTKKIVILLSMIFIITFNIISIEEILIDFNNLQNTTIDFSKNASLLWSEEEKEQMKMDISPKNWIVTLDSSSYTPISKNKTIVYDLETDVLTKKNQKVLAVRVFFPRKGGDGPSNLTIIPPFEIPSFYPSSEKENDKMGTMFLNKGVIRNVGILRKITVLVCGNNFSYAFYVKIRDQKGNIRDLYCGPINFMGWQRLVWSNPFYEEEQRAKEQERKAKPYYPDEMPYIKLLGFTIIRNEMAPTGNFIVMIKEVTVDYDEYYLELNPEQRDFIPSVNVQEEMFGIYKEELEERNRILIEKTNKILEKEMIKRIIMHKQEKQYK